MKKRWHYTTAGILLLSLTTGLVGGASAEPAGDAAKETSAAAAVTVEAVPALKMGEPMVLFGASTLGLLQGETHQRNYLKLLVKTYTPESEAAWQEAFNERKLAEQQFPKPVAARQISLSRADVSVALPDKGETISAEAAGPVHFETVQPLAAEPKELKTFTVRLKQGPDGEEANTLTIRPTAAAGIRTEAAPISESELPPSFKLQADFTKAVEADDAEAIRELLPKLLEDYKSQTVQLKETAEKFKQQQEKLQAAEQQQAEQK